MPHETPSPLADGCGSGLACGVGVRELEAALISQRLFDGNRAEGELEELLNAVPFEKLGWDEYDNSLEICGVPPEYRASGEVLGIVAAAGFTLLFMHHTDHWETHYSAPVWKPWRVSYPHKRPSDGRGILVEEIPASWPGSCTDGNYVEKMKP